MSEIKIIQADALLWLERESKNGYQFDCIITDPPYDSLMKWQGIGTTARMGFGIGKDATQSDKFFETIDRNEMWEVLNSFARVVKDNSHVYIMADHEYMPILLGWVRESGELPFNYSKSLVWDKIDSGMGYHWRATHEYIVMLEKGKRKLNNLGRADVLRHKRVQGKEKYPTEKPLSLMEELILNSTQPGEWILDPFCGSGTTGVAALKHNRNCVLIDKSEKAIEWSRKRINAMQNQASLI